MIRNYIPVRASDNVEYIQILNNEYENITGRVGCDNIMMIFDVNVRHSNEIKRVYEHIDNKMLYTIPLYNVNDVTIMSNSSESIEMGIRCNLKSNVTRFIRDSREHDFYEFLPYFGNGSIAIKYEKDTNIPIQLEQKLDIKNSCYYNVKKSLCYDLKGIIRDYDSYNLNLEHEFNIETKFFNPTLNDIHIRKGTKLCQMYCNELSPINFKVSE